MEDIEAHRDDLLNKFQNLKRQRDEFLEKGRMVEEERNDFLRTNQTMEQRLEEFKKKYNNMKKQNGDLNRSVRVIKLLYIKDITKEIFSIPLYLSNFLFQSALIHGPFLRNPYLQFCPYHKYIGYYSSC